MITTILSSTFKQLTKLIYNIGISKIVSKHSQIPKYKYVFTECKYKYLGNTNIYQIQMFTEYKYLLNTNIYRIQIFTEYKYLPNANINFTE